MTLRSLAARGLSFAHLAGIGSARAEDDKDEKEEKDKDDKKDDEPDDKKEGRRAQRADESDDEYAEYNEDEDEKDKEAKRAKAEDDKKDDKDADDEDDDEEMRGNSASAKARRREQARCAAIFASKAATRNPVLAANLAFKTRMTRNEAIAMLEGTPAPASSAQSSRSARNPQIGTDGGAKPSPQQALAARWDMNLKAANPSRR